MSNQGNTNRAHAVTALLAATKELIQVGELRWSAVEADYRLLVINYVLRRQLV